MDLDADYPMNMALDVPIDSLTASVPVSEDKRKAFTIDGLMG
jgi:hypothetical protein